MLDICWMTLFRRFNVEKWCRTDTDKTASAMSFLKTIFACQRIQMFVTWMASGRRQLLWHPYRDCCYFWPWPAPRSSYLHLSYNNLLLNICLDHILKFVDYYCLVASLTNIHYYAPMLQSIDEFCHIWPWSLRGIVVRTLWRVVGKLRVYLSDVIFFNVIVVHWVPKSLSRIIRYNVNLLHATKFNSKRTYFETSCMDKSNYRLFHAAMCSCNLYATKNERQ